ncbi:MAG TPA: ornithine-acyl-ACP acyltransferase [Rhodobacteraceae bacterium]|jgi:putative hemolysin|nr:ornithine-acyl-ACP acyltransferase [Paracoccaceae bacterium]
MIEENPKYDLRLAKTQADLEAAQRLRYEIFVAELGGDGPLVDHQNRLECDEFDAYFDHLLLIDKTQAEGSEKSVIGVYRLLRSDMAEKAGRFYSEDEYDLDKLKNSGRKLLELGRSCVRKDYRGTAAMYHLWNGLGAYVVEHNIDLLFGVASFHGTDVEKIREPLAYLHHNYLVAEELRVRVKAADFQTMDLMPAEQIDRRAAMRQMPTLIKAYLRMGGCVGEGVFLDHNFNTTDVLVMMDTAKVSEKQRNMYTKGRHG